MKRTSRFGGSASFDIAMMAACQGLQGLDPDCPKMQRADPALREALLGKPREVVATKPVRKPRKKIITKEV